MLLESTVNFMEKYHNNNDINCENFSKVQVTLSVQNGQIYNHPSNRIVIPILKGIIMEENIVLPDKQK